MSKSLAERRNHYTQLIQSQIKSGTPIQIFCKSHNLPQSTFYYWRKKLVNVLEKKDNRQSPRFVPLSVSPTIHNHDDDTEAASISISFPSGVTVRISGNDSFAQSMFSSVFRSDKIQ